MGFVHADKYVQSYCLKNIQPLTSLILLLLFYHKPTHRATGSPKDVIPGPQDDPDNPEWQF